MAMTGGKRGRRRTLLAVATTLTLRQVLLGSAAIVVLASGLFGGLATARPDTIAPLHAGARTSATPFAITVERARWLTDLGGTVAKPRGRYIAVVATIRNTSDHPAYSSEIQRAVRLTGVPSIYAGPNDDELVDSADADPRVLVIADGTTLTAAVPGVTFEVVYLWDQASTSEPPSSVGIDLVAHTWRRSSLDDQMMWFDPTVVRRGTIELKPGGGS